MTVEADAPLTEQQYLNNAIAALRDLDDPSESGDESDNANDGGGERAEAAAEKPEADADAAEEDSDKEGEASESDLAATKEEAESPEPEKDPLALLEEEIRQRAAKREEPAPPDPTAPLLEKIADLERRLNERKTSDEAELIAKLARDGRWKELAEAAGHEPLKAYDDFTKAAADGDSDSTKRQLAALMKRLDERDARDEKRQREEKERAEKKQQAEAQRAAEQAQRRAISDFLDYTAADGEATTYPHVRNTPDGKRARDCVYYAQRLQAAGREVTFDAVAELMEAEYSGLARAWAPKSSTADGGKPKATKEHKRTKGAATTAERGEPETISNDLAAQSSGPDDREKTSEEYFADMMKVLQGQ